MSILSTAANTATAAVMASPVLSPGRDEARGWAEEELSDPAYREADLTLLERLGRELNALLDRLFESATGVESVWLLPVVVIAVVLFIAVIVWRVGRGSGGALRMPRLEAPVLPTAVDPAVLRARAAAAAAAGDWRLAVQEGVRAVLAGLGAAGTIEITPSSTATELTSAAAAAHPEHAAELRWAGQVFDAVSFGDAQAVAADHERIQNLDARLLGTKPAHSAPPTAQQSSQGVPG